MINIAVIVPTLTNKEGGYEALQSIKSSFDIMWMPIIMDNWRNARSVSASWNEGIDIAISYGVDYILIINDDILFSPWTLTGLVRAYERTIGAGVGMVTGLNMRDHMEPNDIFNIDIPSSLSHDYAEHPDFSCFMITKQTFEKVGRFDENFKPAYFEDNDYHRRINLLGLKAICTPWAPYYHYGSITQNKNIDRGDPVVHPIHYEMNQAYYIRKWGGIPGLESYDHPYDDLTKAASSWTYFK